MLRENEGEIRYHARCSHGEKDNWRTNKVEVIIAAVLNSVAYQHKTQAESVIPEAEFRPSNLSYLRHFPKDTEEDKNSFGITDNE
jgi:hypothetical protein